MIRIEDRCRRRRLNIPNRRLAASVSWVVFFLAFASSAMGDAPDADTHAKTVAKEILTSAGIKAGLCVQLGCGDGTLAAELAQRARLLVYGLDSNAEAVARARRNLRSRGLYGRVSVEHRGSYKNCRSQTTWST